LVKSGVLVRVKVGQRVAAEIVPPAVPASAARRKPVDRHVPGEESPGEPRPVVQRDQAEPPGKFGNIKFHGRIDSNSSPARQPPPAIRIGRKSGYRSAKPANLLTAA
jgi:hypothetical protein